MDVGRYSCEILKIKLRWTSIFVKLKIEEKIEEEIFALQFLLRQGYREIF